MNRKKPLMTEEQKRARRHARKAEKINDKAAAGPLFVDQIEKVSADDMRRLWYANVAGGVENMHALEFPQGKPFAKFQERRLRQLAASLLGEDVVTKLNAYRMHVYPGPGECYGRTFWEKVLTTSERIVFGYAREEFDPPQQWAKRLQCIRRQRHVLGPPAGLERFVVVEIDEAQEQRFVGVQNGHVRLEIPALAPLVRFSDVRLICSKLVLSGLLSHFLALTWVITGKATITSWFRETASIAAKRPSICSALRKPAFNIM